MLAFAAGRAVYTRLCQRRASTTGMLTDLALQPGRALIFFFQVARDRETHRAPAAPLGAAGPPHMQACHEGMAGALTGLTQEPTRADSDTGTLRESACQLGAAAGARNLNLKAHWQDSDSESLPLGVVLCGIAARYRLYAPRSTRAMWQLARTPSRRSRLLTPRQPAVLRA